jgi:hypothetical protein
MAGADLDAMIRKLAKQQHKALTAAVKATRDRFNAQAAKTKDGATRQRFKTIAKQAAEEGNAAIRRLQMSADNIADSYARAIRRVTEAALTSAKESPAPKTTATPAKKNAKKAKAKKATTKKTKA